MDKIKVLLVEDEETLAMIIKDTLEGQSFIIHTAADGEEGLRLFFDLRPDVLVADVMMPRMDGFEMVRRIRQTDKHTPVLFLTARSAINDVVEGFELGANDYLKKPFGMQELIIRIKALAGKAFNFTEPAPKEVTDFEIGNYRFNPVTQRLNRCCSARRYGNGTLTPRIGNTEAPLREPQSGGQYPECTARPLGRRQLLQLPQPARIHNEAAPQAGARRPHTHRKRAGDRL